MKNNNSKIDALISLLDDPDTFVYEKVKTALLNSADKITVLQTVFDQEKRAAPSIKTERLSEILDTLKLSRLEADIRQWNAEENPGLLEGMLHIARYGFPNLDEEEVSSHIARMTETVKPEIAGKTPEEIAGLLNRVILGEFGFNGDLTQYNNLYNSFINKVTENKVSNPIGLSILYLLIAKRLGIPLVGINSPGHFVLGYLKASAKDTAIRDIEMDDVEFFIDPFNKGQLIEKESFVEWLNKKDLPQQHKNELFATDKAIIKRVFNNLIYALFTSGEKNTADKLLHLAECI